MEKKREIGLSKKAQITLFMLIGIVIVGGAALTFRTVQVKTKLELEDKAEEVTQQLLKTTALEEYITLCLKEAGARGLTLLGAQGGVIYRSQNGTTVNYYEYPPSILPIPSPMPWTIEKRDSTGEVVSEEEIYVFYGLDKPALLETNPKHQPPPQYPYPGFLKPQQNWHKAGNHFGILILKPLCDIHGPNRPGEVLYKTCETYSPPGSVQEELAKYIVNGIKECVEFEEFSKIIGYNLSEGEVKAKIIVTENNIIFDVEYPVEITIKNKRASKSIRFRTEMPLRLMKIHEYLSHYMERAANDLFFNMTKDYKNITVGTRSYWQPGFKYSIVKYACAECPDPGRYDTLITITDEQSKIKEEEYVFQFMMRNRIPALEWIHMPSPMSDEYDIIVLENTTLTITPQGYDADQDELTYSYSGWKADYSEIHTFAGKQITSTKVESTEENQWESSLKYLMTGKDGKINITYDDIGPHNFIVNVTDTAGNSDYQIVRILVNDEPEVHLELRNIFNEINNRYASIEDPYVLDTSGTIARYDYGLTFRLIDSLENYDEAYTERIVYLPEQEPDITTIKDEIFSELGEHEIVLSVTDNMYQATGLGTVERKMEVYQCLPHESDDPIYPFNSGNPYLADHTCCKELGNYEDEGTVCFTDIEYGPITKFKDKKYSSSADPKYAALDYDTEYSGACYSGDIHYISYNSIIGTSSGCFLRNAIFKRTFSAKCSGERGNICDTDPEEKIELSERCIPDDYIDGQELCKGSNPTGTSCQNYNGESFEEIEELKSIDGKCDTRLRCTQGEGETYGDNTNGPYICKGSCGGGGCKVAVGCECNVGCGAVCDDTKKAQLTDDTCNFGCKSNCQWQDSEYCPSYKLTSSEGKDYCSWGANCVASGCYYENKVEIDNNNQGCTANGPEQI